jgi:hypothetical protein
MRDSINRQYTADWIQHGRPQPMYDTSINDLYAAVFLHTPIHNQQLPEDFKREFRKFITGHTLSKYTGIDAFAYDDICVGCTQFIDDIYQRVGTSNVMTFEKDYKYHWRLNNDITYVTIDTLDPSKELIIAMPFPGCGDVHPDMYKILDRCSELKIPVHIDGAWMSCSRDIEFNFDHPAIQTFAMSLSKGGLGTDRIAIRYSRTRPAGAITIMNDFNMNCKSLMHIGIQFMQLMGPDYFWKKYENAYYKVCSDFNLTPTKSIHVAKDKAGEIVGIRPLLRFLNDPAKTP